MARRNTKLESEGAEFLVLGHLLTEGIQAFKAYTNFPGYDIIATKPDRSRSCRVSVKSRWATDFDGGFIIKNFDCDFVVFVALNRGYCYRCGKSKSMDGRRSPKLYVFPKRVVQRAQDPDNKWGKVFLREIDSVEKYADNWKLIADFLAKR